MRGGMSHPFLCEVQIIFKEESCWFGYFTSRIELQFLLNVSFTVQTRGILTSAGLRWPPVWIDMCACMNMMSLENHQSPA